MAKQLNIDVNLNTAKATQQLQALQQALTQAIQGAAGSGNGALTKEIVKATEAAVKLKSMLSQSMNADTGNLDLSKFSQQLAKNKVSLQDYARQLTALGPHGEKAFMQMSKAIVSAETPMRQSSKLMNNLWTTMKNTARWQISSAALHTFIGGLQSAMSYARGLNESLNSIRIVTGQSAQEMDAFAQRANKSAKELSASTLDYTDAALIYYQQGIRDQQQIKERTDATIKMSNVTGESASKVSEELTAIWNNFDDGSKNLEYYADVITALGANTASSSKEIAQGLSKFAAVADTVGLSYEYATSALATIVATTRQSADVVGTALKTLFARIQDLDLGKTLDDGTTLGKYSSALDAVGIAIKDQHGELRNMDDILDDMGSKWTTLSKDQQVALAQTVAGTRQYTQLVALMDNWDFMKENLMVAKGSEGELQKQADIYAESWKAAKDRVKASMQGIYDDLISDKFFIGLNNTLATALSGLDKFIDSIGGIPGVLGLVGIALTTVFKDQFGKVIESNIQKIRVMSGMAQREANQLRNQAMQTAAAYNKDPGGRPAEAMEAKNLQRSLLLADQLQKKKEQIAAAGKTMSSANEAEIRSLMSILELYQDIAVQAQKTAEATREKSALDAQGLRTALMARNLDKVSKEKKNLNQSEQQKLASAQTNQAMSQLTSAKSVAHDIGVLQKGLQQLNETGTLSTGSMTAMAEAIQNSSGAFLKAGDNLERYKQQLNTINKALKEVRDARHFQEKVVASASTPEQRAKEQAELDEIQAKENKMLKARDKAGKKIYQAENEQRLMDRAANAVSAQELALANPDNSKMRQAATRAGQEFIAALQDVIKGDGSAQFNAAIDEMISNLKANNARLKGQEIAEQIQSGLETGFADFDASVIDEGSLEDAGQQILDNIDEAEADSLSATGQAIMDTFQGLSSLSMGISSVSSAISALNNEDLSFGEKLLSVTMSLSLGIPMIVGGITTLKASIGGVAASFSAFTTNALINTAALDAETAAIYAQQVGALGLGTKIKLLIAQKLGLVSAQQVSSAAAIEATIAELGEVSALELLSMAAAKAAAVLGGFIAAHWPIIAIIGSLVALGVLINKISKDMKEMSPEGQLKAAKEEATSLKEGLEQTKQAAEDLNQAFDKYQSAQDALASCAEGTKEWTQALQEANLETLELLRNYPQLVKYLKSDDNGRKYFSDEGIEEARNMAAENVNTASMAYTAANQRVQSLDLSMKTNDVLSKITGDIQAQQILKDNLDRIIQMTPGEEMRQGLKDIFKENDLYGAEIFADNINSLLSSNDGLMNELTNLAINIQANTETTKAENEIMAQNALANNEVIKNNKNAAEITKAISGQISKNEEAKKAEYMADFKKGSRIGENEARYQAYMDAHGIKGENLTVQGNQATYEDVNGDVQTLKGSVVAAFLAMSDASQQANADAEKLAQTFAQLDAASKQKDLEKLSQYDVNRGLTSTDQRESVESQARRASAVAAKELLIDKDLDNLTQKQTHLLNNIGDIKSQLESLFGGEEGLKEAAIAAGFEDAQSYIDSFKESLSNANNIWDSIDMDKFAGLKNADQLGANAAKQLENTFDKIEKGPMSEKLGKNGSDILKTGINRAIEGLSPEKQSEALNKIAQIDFSQTSNGAEAIAAAVRSLGVDIDTTSQFWRAFNNDMQRATGYAPNFENLISQLTTIQDLLSKLNFGDAIEAEDYESIIANNSELEDSFMKLADGSYRFIGSQEDASKAMLQNAYDTLDAYEQKSQATKDYMKLLDKEGDISKFNADETSQSAKLAAIKELTNSEAGQNLLIEVGYDVDEESLNQLLGNADLATEAYDRVTQHITDFTGEMNLQQAESLASLTANIEQLNALKSTMDNTNNAAIFDEAYNKQAMYFMMTAENAEELINVIEKFKGSLADLPMDSLDALAEKFANVKAELEDIQRLKTLGTEGAELAGAEGELEGAIAAAGIAEKYGEGTNAVEAMMHSIAEANGYLDEQGNLMKDQVSTVARLTDQYLGVANTIANAADKAETYTIQLQAIQALEKKGDSLGASTSAGYQEIADTLSGLIGVSKDAIKHDYITKAVDPKTFQNACKGDVKAIYSLRNSFVEFQAEADGVSKEVASAFADMMNELGENADIDIGSAAFQNFISELNNVNAFAGMTADEIRSKLEQDYNIHVDGLEAIGTFESVEAAMASMAAQGIETQNVIMSMGADVEAENTEIESTDSDTIAQINAEDNGDTYTVETPQFEGDMTASGSITMAGSGSIGAEGGSFSISPTGDVKFGGSVTASAVPNTLKAGGITETAETEDVEKPKTQTVTAFKMVNPKTGAVGGGGGTNIANRKARTCFIAGTLVSTIDGYKNIEEIQVGDIVLSYNEQLNKNEYSKVLQTMIHYTFENIYTIEIEDEQIQATGSHPFYIIRNNKSNWIPACELKVGDIVLFADLTLHTISNITKKIKLNNVYNFEVANNHNYYVGKNQILVHNKGGGGGCFIAGTLVSTIDGYKNIEEIQVGDIVLSYNENLQKNVYSQVLETMIHLIYEDIYIIYVENEIIQSTGIHKFYIMRNNQWNWIEAEKLVIGDQVLFANGTLHTILDIKTKFSLETVYNFEVSNTHNYYIGKNQILVHNKGGGRRRCFVSGTLVATNEGQKTIENIKVGDIVLSYNEKYQKNEYSLVLQTMIHQTIEKIYTLQIENDFLQVTGMHPFYIIRNEVAEWISVENILLGDQVLFADGTLHYIKQINFEIKTKIVYNLEVANNHNYFVGINKILVHNKGGGGGGRAARHTAAQQKVARRAGDPFAKDQGKIDKIKKQMDILSETTGRVYGKRRVDMMQDILKLYDKEIKSIEKLNEKKREELKLSKDRLQGKNLTTEFQWTRTQGESTFNEIASDFNAYEFFGLGKLIEYDKDGMITNFDELKIHLDEVYNNWVKTRKEAASAAEQETDIYKNEVSWYESMYQGTIDLLDETQKFQESLEEGLEAQRQELYAAHDQFAEMLEYKLQVKIELVDGDLKIIDTKLRNIGDSIYKSVEALSLLWNQDGFSQYDSILEKGTDYMEHWDEINEHYDPAKWQELDQLTQQAYIDQAGEVRDGLLEQAEALMDLREAYEAYYGDTLSKATEEIEKYTRQIEHNANVLEHLQNLLDLTGRQFDYDAKDTLIRGRLSVAADDYQQAANWAALTKENAEDAKRQYEELLEIDKLGAERFKKEVLDKAVDYALEAEETMYSKAEEYAGHLEELWENTLNKANDAWERVATMGDGWDYLSDSMERAKAIQEEYLTTTNKLYETNTLLRKLDKDMNNANNQLSKDKLASFAKEVEQAQISNKLAKSSMEILKARYELLQAEMALEDAKDAKAIVRLQRDNEGNYGYVYTADPDKENDAEQNRADKENDLYNLVLGYQNDYQEKTMQSRREFQEAYSQIWQDFYDGRIATAEERERKLAELKEQYSELWKAYDISLTDSEYWLNQVAATDVSEAWAHSYQDRRSNQQDFMKACKDAHDELDAIMIDINKVRDQLTKDTQLGLSDVKKKTDEVTTANKLLTNELVHDVQPKVDDMIDKVGAATRAFEAHAAEIQNVINKYLTLAQVIQNTMRLQSGYNTPDWSVKTSADIAAKDTIGEAADMKSRSQTVGANHMSKEGGYITNNLENAVIQRISNRAGVQWENTRDTMLSGGVIEGVEGEDKEILSLMASQSSARKVNNSSDETQTFQWLVDQGTPQNVLDALNPTQYNIDWDKITGYKPKGYDTGGYTGAWGDEGKLALLHEKELVLNATDTQNILDTVELLRGITASFNLQAGLENMMASMVTPLFSNNGETLQQEVHITAEFPNVSDRNEIEEAFKTLVNEASQYANRY